MRLNITQWYKILAPRPVVLITTVNSRGISNAAPFSFVMPTSCDPPLVAFASDPGHHTVKNILKTKDFVVNIPGSQILKKLWICADDFPAGVSEIKKAGLTEQESIKVKSSRIKECLAHFECGYFKHYKTGDHLIIIGKVLLVEARDEYIYGRKYSVDKANPLMHLGGNEFGLLGRIVKAQ